MESKRIQNGGGWWGGKARWVIWAGGRVGGAADIGLLQITDVANRV